MSISGFVHSALDVAGFVPGLGAVPDLVNGLVYTLEGDHKNAALSVAAAVPVVGDGVKAGAMLAKAGKAVAGTDRVAAGALAAAKHDTAAAHIARQTAEAAQPAARRQGAHAPNAVVTYNDYAYRTDALGRVSRTHGELQLNPAQGRNGLAQREAGGADRLATDQGGHYVGRRFNGPTEAINHFAQDGVFNNGAYKALENAWERAVASGQKVVVDIRPTYLSGSLRPDRLEVRWAIDGKWSSKVFHNGMPADRR